MPCFAFKCHFDDTGGGNPKCNVDGALDTLVLKTVSDMAGLDTAAQKTVSHMID